MSPFPAPDPILSPEEMRAAWDAYAAQWDKFSASFDFFGVQIGEAYKDPYNLLSAVFLAGREYEREQKK